jgi:hypothetical protein
LISWFVAMSIHTDPEEVTNMKSAECGYNCQILPRLKLNPIPTREFSFNVSVVIFCSLFSLSGSSDFIVLYEFLLHHKYIFYIHCFQSHINCKLFFPYQPKYINVT